MKQTRHILYLATLVLLIVWAVDIGCKGKEKSKELSLIDSLALNSDWYVPDTSRDFTFKVMDGSGIFKGEYIDTIRVFDLIISDSLGENVATKENGKWTIVNCEKALEVMLKSHNDLAERCDELLKKLYKEEETETPIGTSFAKHKKQTNK